LTESFFGASDAPDVPCRDRKLARKSFVGGTSDLTFVKGAGKADTFEKRVVDNDGFESVCAGASVAVCLESFKGSDSSVLSPSAMDGLGDFIDFDSGDDCTGSVGSSSV
jgi:hypothetical protein